MAQSANLTQISASPQNSAAFTLELLHIADQEASSAAVADAPNFSAVLNALRAQDLGGDGVMDNTLTLSSGDAFIPGVFFDASAAVFGAGGIADIQIQNELGVSAIALGNHEFDFGTSVLANLITGTSAGALLGSFAGVPSLAETALEGADFAGTAFPYLSANLDFATDPNLAPHAVAGGQAPQGNAVTSSTVVEVGGERIAVVGATTPTLPSISSSGDLVVAPDAFDATPTLDQLDALATLIQAEVDAVLAADAGIDKVVLLSHMQRISIEYGLAERLTDVDIIVAGGSNTRLLDDDDRLRDGDSDQGQYPQFLTNAGGTQTAVVNTDGSYKYVGRLVIDFDADGHIVTDSYDASVSGAYATDDRGVADLGAEGLVDPEVRGIADAIGAQIVATESNVFGLSDVFLNGNRSGVAGDPDGVRTQETNLGNLTADANLAVAKEADPDVVVSIKNGGGIRASIGETVVPPGGTEAVRGPNAALTNADGDVFKPAGGISQNDISTALAFNNDLTVLSLTRAELVAVLEHGVSALPDVAGQFPQVAGLEFAFDPDRPAGSRIVSAEIVDGDGAQIAALVRDGALVGDAAETFRVVTLGFLADGGDGYPFPTEGVDRLDLTGAALSEGDASFAAAGTEQDALAEYLADNFARTPYAIADTGPDADTRIQNLDVRADAVFDDAGPLQALVLNEVLGSTTGTDSEYIELFGEAGTSLDGLSVIVVESDAGASNGMIDFRLDFGAGDAIGANGFFLAANGIAAATYGVTPNLAIADNSIENSSYTIALVETASLAGGAVTGQEVVLDAVGVTDGEGPESFAFGAPVVGPDGTFLPAGVGRVEDGVDTDQASDFEILNFNNGAPNSPTAGTMGDDGEPDTGDVTIDDTPTLVSAIQGAGEASPLVGQAVVVEAIVTGDFQSGDDDDFRNLDGFFLMEERSDFDADDMTSEGIFAFEGGDTQLDVAAGDRVRVLGTVVERFGKTTIEVAEIRIEDEAVETDILSLAVESALPPVAAREALESMLVDVNEPLTFTESFDYETFNDGTLAAGGSVYQYTQLNAPDMAGNAAYQAEVADRTITIDDGRNAARDDFDPIPEPDGDPFTLTSGVRMGQDFDLTAIMDFDFGEWRLRLPEGAAFEPLPGDARPDAPVDVGSDYKVASLNVLNYFTTLEGETDIGQGPRGADSVEEFERQSDKLVSVIRGMDADVIALNEIENDFAGESFAIAELVSRLNAGAEGAPWAFVDPGQEFVGGDAIAVAFLYNSETTRLAPGTTVATLTDDQLAGLGVDPGNPVFEGPSTSRVPLAATFEEIATGERFTAAANHFKSKGSVSPFGDNADRGDGAGANDEARAQAAAAVEVWLASDPTGSNDPDRIILGDLNSYAQETPLQVLAEAGYTNLVAAEEGLTSTSYRFSGQVGTLDYALANDAMARQVTGATIWDVNDEEPVFFDYNLDGTFTDPLRPTDLGLFDGSSPAASSDHDPVVVGLDLGADAAPVLVLGTAGNDNLRGTETDERLVSGGGRLDVLRGAGGADIFEFTSEAGARNSVQIRDFDASEGDLIDLGGATLAGARELGANVLLQLAEDGDSILVLGTDFAGLAFTENSLIVA
ncbi:ExeM/NucH family extracellular endonuclease [uncultured Jannaschia sp.]|uniref:ExeM/NucH family extracellular endonuclease n=1 Tax=uncultured Jannaschia sp. TaxID=293347 RepID=UPI00260AFCB2|nr:ExeM/NucH family extracellular endonuclease [uncultured Jannaschia sp.]